MTWDEIIRPEETSGKVSAEFNEEVLQKLRDSAAALDRPVATIYPLLKGARYRHDALRQRFGGRPGVLDIGLRSSALARPRSGHRRTISEQAAAFALTEVFLKLNELTLAGKARAGVKFIEEDCISKRASLEKITGWIEKHASCRGARSLRESD